MTLGHRRMTRRARVNGQFLPGLLEAIRRLRAIPCPEEDLLDVAYGGKGLSFDDEDRATDTVEPLGNDAEYPLCLAYAGLAVRHRHRAANRCYSSATLSGASFLLDSDLGDYICIGALTEGGLQFSQDSFEFEAES